MGYTPKRHLPRLEKHHYQGHATVFWTLTLKERGRGWLTKEFHHIFRELMLHATYRHEVWSPVYCLMPDHIHLMWMGTRKASDQLNSMKFLRSKLEPVLGPGREWQHQPHDHVLKQEERRRNAFAQTCDYILANPFRAGLVSDKQPWPFGGCMVPGYPGLHPREPDFWPIFWKLYVTHREEEFS